MGHLPPKPVFTFRHFGEIVEHLSKNNLVFSVKVDEHTSEPWQIIDHALHVHLDIHGFKITHREGDDGKSFNMLSWDIFGQVKKSKDKLDFKLGLVVDDDLTLEFLTAEAIEVPIDKGGPKVPCLLLGRQPSCHSIYHPHLHV
jgi:hypothetical protein